MNPKRPKLITIKEAADAIRCSADKVERLIRERKFTTYKIGGDYRIEEISFYTWLQGQVFDPMAKGNHHAA